MSTPTVSGKHFNTTVFQHFLNLSLPCDLICTVKVVDIKLNTIEIQLKVRSRQQSTVISIIGRRLLIDRKAAVTNSIGVENSV